MTQSTWVQDIASEAQTNSNKEWQDMVRKNEIGCELHIAPCWSKGLNRKVRWKLLPQKTSTSLKELSDWFLGISGERHPQYDHCHSWVDERSVYCLHMFHQGKTCQFRADLLRNNPQRLVEFLWCGIAAVVTGHFPSRFDLLLASCQSRGCVCTEAVKTPLSHEKKKRLVGLYRGLYYPVIYGL